MITGRMGKISVFCSYAREDESYRRALQECLSPIRAEKVIDDWYDDRIQPGARWNTEIGEALERARLVLFIVSPDLLASRYVQEVELPKALELERGGRCQIVPIVARATEWGGSPLAEFQALPKGARPVESYSAAEIAYAEIAGGLREVCKRIVDWENPYKRARVGDWTHVEQTMTLPDGESVTAEATTELVERSEERAVLLVEAVVDGEETEKNLVIDLTQPLEDGMGDYFSQIEEALPRNLELRMGPSRFEEEILMIGGKRYETIKQTREVTFGQSEWEEHGSASTWRCIDVPLDGIVKGAGEVPSMRQRMVLLDCGHGDAAARKPALVGGTASTGLVGPGRWRVQMSAFGVGTNLDLTLEADGTLAGRQELMGVVADLQGAWAFDRNDSILMLQMTAMMGAMPVGQDLIHMQITGGDAGLLHAVDDLGRQFALEALG